MTRHKRVTIPEHVMARQVGEDCVMLDLASGTYFGLDRVGARAWQLLAEGRTIPEVCERMVEEYDAPREKIEQDVTQLVEQLIANGLVRPE